MATATKEPEAPKPWTGPLKRIKLKSAIAGANFAHAVGDAINWREDEAIRFIEKGLAEEFIPETPARETAERKLQAEKR